MVNEIINNRSQLIDKKAFEEFYQNEHKKTLLIYRIGIIFLLVINVILIIFYFLYKCQISNTKNNSVMIVKEIEDLKLSYKEKEKITNRRLVNYYSNKRVLSYLMIENIKTKEEYDTLIGWSELDRNNTIVCFKGTYDKHSAETFRNFCYNDKLLIVLKLDNGKRIGGFISNFWLGDDDTQYSDDKAFLFSLDTLKKYPIRNKEKAFFLRKGGFFSFGREDLYISDNYTEGGCYAKFPIDYGDPNDDVLDFTGGREEFAIVEMEILSELIL